MAGLEKQSPSIYGRLVNFAGFNENSDFGKFDSKLEPARARGLAITSKRSRRNASAHIPFVRGWPTDGNRSRSQAVAEIAAPAQVQPAAKRVGAAIGAVLAIGTIRIGRRANLAARAEIANRQTIGPTGKSAGKGAGHGRAAPAAEITGPRGRRRQHSETAR